MRRLAIALCLTLLVLPLTGCLKSKATYALKKDGSGTISSSYEVHLSQMRELLSTALMMINPDAAQKLAGLDDAHLPNPVAPEWLRALAKDADGYEITAAADKIKDGVRTSTVEAKFETLEAAARGGAFFTFIVSLSRVEKSEALPKGAWKLLLKDIFLGSSSDAMGGMSASEMAPMFETQLKTLKLTNVVTLPTPILETNGTKNEAGDTVSWTIDYEKVVAGKDVSMSVTFEAAEDLKLKPFTYKPDPNAIIKRMQQSAPKAKPEAVKPTPGQPLEPKDGEGAPKEVDAPKPAAPKSVEPKSDDPKSDAPKPDAPKGDDK